MDKKLISTLVNSLSSEPRGLAGKYADKSVGQIAKEEIGISFIVNNAFALEHLLWMPDLEDKWFVPTESLNDLSAGLIGHVGVVPVYSDWYYGRPEDRMRPCDKIPRVGVVQNNTNEIFLLTVEQFRQ